MRILFVNRDTPKTAFCAGAVLATSFLAVACAGAESPAWQGVNARIIGQKAIAVRNLPYDADTGVYPNLEPGRVTDMAELPRIKLAPGVSARVFWGSGNLVSLVAMEAGSEIPAETLPAERIMIVMGGTLEQLVDGEMRAMRRDTSAPLFYFSTGYVGEWNYVYLPEGSQNRVKAGPEGASFAEFYFPVRADYVEATGSRVPETARRPGKLAAPSIPANRVLDLHEVPLAELVPGAMSRILGGAGVQVSALDMAPGVEFGYHTHPEEQIMVATRGAIKEYVLDSTQPMTMDPATGKQSVLFLPSQMVHGGLLSAQGCSVFDVFYPVREDYARKLQAARDAYHTIIPEGEKPVLLAKGFQFTEGPAWMGGEYYFSSMFFDIPAGTWKPDPGRSDLIAMKPDGSWRYVLRGKMQTNGLAVDGEGRIVACDMAGHRLVALTPGREVAAELATRVTSGETHAGLRLDGPNDLVIDAAGGIYFTDPQFIAGEPARPSKTLNYLRPDGEVVCVVENPGNREFQMMNGVELSPDGQTLYVNNTYHLAGVEGKESEAENFVYAYDVHADGSVANKRRFAELLLPPGELSAGNRSTCADGMTVDERGNLYVATNVGLQILDPGGRFVGLVHTPTFPVSVCFGGENFDTLFMTCWDKIYTVKTKVKGLARPHSTPRP